MATTVVFSLDRRFIGFSPFLFIKLLEMKKTLKIVGGIVLILFSLFTVITIFSYWYVGYYSEEYVYKRIEELPKNEFGLLLGTRKTLNDGTTNSYFQHRIDAMVELYDHGKIRYIIVSGDNYSKGFNEPRDIKDALIEHGIPETVVYVDNYGLRTYDSIVRCKLVFGQAKFTVVSQEFHIKRAIFIAKQHDIEIYGFKAKDAILGFKGRCKEKLREALARLNAIIDVSIDKKPIFLNKKYQFRN